MVVTLRPATIALAGLAAIAVFATVAHETDAGTYWAVGLPQAENGQSYSAGTLLGATNAGPAAATAPVTVLKAGTAPAGTMAPALINAGDTGLFTIQEQYQGSQISAAATYTVETPGTAWEVMQLSNPNPTFGGAFVTGSDATHLLEQTQLGKLYNVATYSDFPIQYIGGSPSYFTIVATKDSTTVKVIPSVKTAGSVTCPVQPCTLGDRDVGPMLAATTYTYTLMFGEALHVESADGNLACRAWPLTAPDPLGCYIPTDPTNSLVSCSTACAVFAGAYVVSMQDGFSTKSIYTQINPEASAGEVFVLCSAFQSKAGNLDMLRIRSMTAPAVISVASANGLSLAPTGPFSITSAVVNPLTWTTFYMNRDAVITSDERIHVVQYNAQSKQVSEPYGAGRFAAAGNWFQPTLLVTYGGPSMTQVSAMDLSTERKDFYTPPGWRTFVYVALQQNATVTLDDHTSGVSEVLDSTHPAWRAIPGSNYACVTPMLSPTVTPSGGGSGGVSLSQTSNGVSVAAQASENGATATANPGGVMASAGWAGGAGDTYTVTNNIKLPITVQVLGQGPQVSWFMDLGGGQKDSSPPPVTISFKGVAQVVKCGPTPIQFTAATAGGVPPYTWFWDFGDGATSTDENPTHMYPAPGEYLATVAVMDSLGEDEQFQEFVTVTQVEPCVPPTKPQSEEFAPRPPHDGVDESIADSDTDKDGIANAVDNCVFTSNADQSDIDVDDSGDLCDTDMDNDGVVNAGDNCVDISNGSQLDQNGDGEGDLCDVDVDGDAVLNVKDNCPQTPNTDQVDDDANQVGDVCEMLSYEAPAPLAAARPVSTDSGTATAPVAAGQSWLGMMFLVLASLALVALLLVVVARRRR